MTRTTMDIEVTLSTDNSDPDHAEIAVEPVLTRMYEGFTGYDDVVEIGDREAIGDYLAGVLARLGWILTASLDVDANAHGCRTSGSGLWAVGVGVGSDDTGDPLGERYVRRGDPFLRDDERAFGDADGSCQVSVNDVGGQASLLPSLYLTVPRRRRHAWKKRAERELNALLESIRTP